MDIARQEDFLGSVIRLHRWGCVGGKNEDRKGILLHVSTDIDDHVLKFFGVMYILLEPVLVNYVVSDS